MEDQMEPYDGRFKGVEQELNRLMNQPFSGYLSEAMALGSAVNMCLNIVRGQADITDASYRVEVCKGEPRA